MQLRPRLVVLEVEIVFEVGLPFDSFSQLLYGELFGVFFVGIFASGHPDINIIVDDAFGNYEAVERCELGEDIINFERCR